MKKILFALLFITMAFSQFDNTIAGWYNEHYYVPEGSVYSEGLVVVDEGTLATESLDEVDFATHASWDDVNDFDSESGNAAFVWSANQTSTLTQQMGSMLEPCEGSQWYIFTYTVAVTTAFDGDGVATITTGVALAAVALDLSAGTHTLFFYTAVAPGDFVISVVSGSDTEGTWTIDDVTLKEITGGDIDAFGNIFGYGTLGLVIGTTINEISTDGNLGGNSDDAVPTEKAVKAYADAIGGAVIPSGSNNEILTDDGAGAIVSESQLLFDGLDLTVGVSVDDVRPSLKIVGDADSDAGDDVSETIALTLTPNANPLLAYWGFTSTQSLGYRFDLGLTIIAGDLDLSTTADNQLIFAIDNDPVTPSITLEPGTGFYASADNVLEMAIAAGAVWTFTNTYIESNYALGPKIMRETVGVTNPVYVTDGDENSGYGKAHADQPSYIAGGKEVTRHSEGTDYVSAITGHNVADLVTDATTDGTTTITKVGENFLTTVSVGDMVVIWGGLTEGTAYGNYIVVTVTDDENLVLDRVVAAHTGVVDFDVLADGVVIENATDVTNHKARLRVPENAYIGGDLEVGGVIVNSAAGGQTYISTPGIQTIGTGGTFEKLYEGAMAYTGSHLEGFTESNGRLTYTGTPTIHATVVCNLTVQSGEAAQILNFRIAENGTTIAGSNMTKTYTAQTVDRSVGLNWLVELETNDYIEIYGTSDTNGDVFTVQNLSLFVVKH